jgi:phosphopantothenoylcysteine decarboxylase/phosphopantothenate--cysteine ligase
MGIEVIAPTLAEGKAKIVALEDIVAPTLRMMGTHALQKKKVLILGGATTEFIDDVRVITNLSSGRMALALAKKAYEMGATTTLWYGQGAGCHCPLPSFLDTVAFCSSEDLLSLIDSSSPFDLIINCAAISDYKPHKIKGKIPSGQKLTLQFSPTPIINKKLRSKTSLLVGFKLESTPAKITEKAYSRLCEHQLDYIIANTLDTLGADTLTMWLIDRDKNILHKQGTKNDMAEIILNHIYG